MHLINRKKIVVLLVLMTSIVIARSFSQQAQNREAPAPKNLKILPKETTGEDVQRLMRIYSRSLGVKCNFCHASTKPEGNSFPKMDFASDDKTEKQIARKMMVMVDSINTAYISKMGEDDFEKITCVTCHMGRVTPIVSVDSVMAK